MNQVTIHYNAPNWTKPCRTTQYYTTQHCTASLLWHWTVLHCVTLHCTTLHHPVLYHISYHILLAPCSELHCTVLHCTALHFTACTAPHPPAPCFFDMQTRAGPFSPSWLLIFSSWITSVLYCTLTNNGVLWEPQNINRWTFETQWQHCLGISCVTFIWMIFFICSSRFGSICIWQLIRYLMFCHSTMFRDVFFLHRMR